MSKKQEEKLVSCVEQAIRLTQRGMSPSEAVVKAASDNDLTSDMAKRVAEAYNQSKTIHFLSEKQGKERLDTFSIASPDAVSDRLMAANTKIAAHLRSETSAKMPMIGTNFISNHQRSQKIADLKSNSVVKEAQDEPVLPRATQRQRAFREREASYVEYCTEKVHFQEKCAQFNQEFCGGITQESLHEAMYALKETYPSAYEKIAAIINENTNLTKMGFDLFNFDASNMTLTDIIASSRPFATVENLVKNSIALHKSAAKLKEAEEKLAKVKAPIEKAAGLQESSMFSEKGKDVVPNLRAVKEAAPFFPLTSGALGLMRNQSDRSRYEDRVRSRYSDVLSDTLNTLDDPDVRDATNQIRIRAMLNNFLTEDDIISSYDEDEVLDAFNAISQAAPDVSMHAPVMRDMIRKYLVNGGLESLEIGQAVELGKNIGGDHRTRSEQLADLGVGVTPSFSGGTTLSTQGKPTDLLTSTNKPSKPTATEPTPRAPDKENE